MTQPTLHTYWFVLNLKFLLNSRYWPQLIDLDLASVVKSGVTVDRWSALEYFWKGLFNGEFPYAVSTQIDNGNTPSPSPIWQVISFPFVLIGDVGLIQVFVLGIFSWRVYRSCFGMGNAVYMVCRSTQPK